MPRLAVMSMNVGRFLDEDRTCSFIERLGADLPLPDVICVVDIPESKIPVFTKYAFNTFAPMTIHNVGGVRVPVGVAIFSRYPISNIEHHITWGDGRLKMLEGVNDAGERIQPPELADELVLKTEDRVLIVATVTKDEQSFNVATTHGLWTRGGVVTGPQRVNARNLCGAILVECAARDELVLAGDLNAIRGGEIYRTITEHMTDCLPASITTTLDPSHPLSKRAADLKIEPVVDYVMYASRDPGERTYTISDVQMFEGVSDHLALYATIGKDM